MSKPYVPPTGRLSSKAREFEDVVRDIRYAVFSLVRLVPASEPNMYNPRVLGSGFFVSHNTFFTCNHVVNPDDAPHKDGDLYRLVCNLTGTQGIHYQLPDVKVGANLHLYPESDAALIQVNADATQQQPFVALEYGVIPPGREIGVAGYPIAYMKSDLTYDSMIFRVAKGVATASYPTTLKYTNGPLENIPVVEVNFMFVPGNSGGPVFDAKSGRVFGFVQGFNYFQVLQRVQTVSGPLPDGVNPTYIEHMHGCYSVSIKMERARPHLEAHGITL
jgi:hypothetical protein